jgi:two-component system, NarL family, sensor kinase
LEAVLVAAVVVLAALCAYLWLRERRARDTVERLEVLMAQSLESDERSRREIAESLHDQALQTLLAANQDLLEAAPGREGVTRAHEIVGATIEEIREQVSALHPVTLQEGGLATALAAVARRAERQGGFKCELEVDPEATGENDVVVLAVARELLTNAAKHAGAARVEVRVSREGDTAVLEVADDGRGIQPGRRENAVREGHIGLASIAYRVDGAGGTFELETGSGTRAVARVPLQLLSRPE